MRPRTFDSANLNKGMANFKSFIQGSRTKNENILVNLGALDKMANFLDHTLRSNMYRQSSLSSNSVIKSPNYTLPKMVSMF